MTGARTFAGAIACAFVLVSAQATAQEASLGEREYQQNCDTCHGDFGKGDGYLAGFLNVKTADLTQLSRKNDGVFPFDEVMQIIEGRTVAQAHAVSPSTMPVWGDEYNERAVSLYADYWGVLNVESFVQGRILALAAYIYSLQE